MDKTTKAARESGKAYGIQAAELCVSQVSAGGMSDTDEAFAELLARHIGNTARELKGRGMPDHMLRIWMDAAAKAGVTRLQDFAHFLTQAKRTEH